MEEVSLCRSCKTAIIDKYTSVDSVLQVIKKGISPFLQKIKDARSAGKGSPIYETIKRERIPTINWTGKFEGKRSIDTFIETSGYIYYDVDVDVSEATIEIIKLFDFVKAIWRSFGGSGLGVLIRVDGITADNYSTTWSYYADIFSQNGVEVRVDPACKDISRINILSYDPNIWININPTPANAVEFYIEEDKPTQPTPNFALSVQGTTGTERSCINAFNLAVNRHGNFIEGSKHRAKVLYFSTCNVFGVPLHEATSFLEDRTDCKEIDSVGKSIYNLYTHQHGTKANPK